MTTHSLQLANEPFDSIRNGKKVIESRLYDDKRRLIEIGDRIEFINRESPDQKIDAEVTGLHRYASFSDMFEDMGPSRFGGDSAEGLMNQINKFYSAEDQKSDGVIGIQFKLI